MLLMYIYRGCCIHVYVCVLHDIVLSLYVFVAQLSLASKEAANGYTPYHKINKLGMHIRKEMWLT